MPISLDDIPNLEDEMSSDDDLPSFGGPAKKKAPVKKTAAPAAARATASSSSYSKPAAAAAKPASAGPARSYTRVTGKTDVVDRLTAPSSYTGTSSKRFDSSGKGTGLAGRDTGNERVVSDLSQITRSGISATTQPRAKYGARDEESEEEEAPRRDFTEAGMDNEIEEILPEDEAALVAQMEQELAMEDFDLPDFKKGDFGKAPKKAVGRAAVKGTWSGSTNTAAGGGKTRAQLLREGKDVASVREQRETAADRSAAAASSVPKRNCTVAGCNGISMGKRGYCAKCQNEHNQRLQDTQRTAAANAARPASAAAAVPVSTEKCAGCRKGLTGSIVTALNQKWHPDCFKCSGCHADFPSGKFVVISNKPYCRSCASAAQGSAAAAGASATACNGCKRAITGRGVEALGAHWHPACFNCTHCGKQFPGGKFSTVKNQPFCNQACFEEHLGI